MVSTEINGTSHASTARNGHASQHYTRLQNKRVLVIEDEPLLLMDLEHLITQIGCKTVATAMNLSEGLDKAAAVECDVAILDVNLQGENSFAIAEALRCQNVPFVFVTGYDHSVLGQFNAPILSKPLNEAQLAVTLQEILE